MRPEIRKILDQMKFWKQIVENVKDFTGTSPPSIFVGKAFYPKVYVGILAPPTHEESAFVLDSPEIWYKRRFSIDRIITQRGKLIYSRFRSDIKNPSGKLVDVIQELAMARKQTDVEIELKKNPQFRFQFDPWVSPIGNPAPVERATLTENPSIERRVDYLVSDVDIKAQNAVIALYKYGLPVSRIQKIFSSGLLGVQIQRKLVPTKWGITATDDIIGKFLRDRIETYPQINEVMLFRNEYIGNHYQILLIPDVYQYELIEIWHVAQKIFIDSDFEPQWGKKEYASKTAGAFYAGRLAVMEYLEKIKRQASVLIIREIGSSYFAPVGIWQMRETVRDALNKPVEKFGSLESALKRITENLQAKEWVMNSKLVRNLKQQKKITDFK